MGQKRVTFEVAKAIKEAGYPQENCDMYYPVPPKYQDIGRKVAQPTYLEVWLWLWQHKGIWLDMVKTGAELFTCYLCGEHIIGYHSDPEEAIEAAIKYLVTNDLIK